MCILYVCKEYSQKAITIIGELLIFLPVSTLLIRYTVDKLNLSKESKTPFFLYAIAVVFTLALIFNFNDEEFSFHDLNANFNSLLFDLALFGILLSIIEELKSKQVKEKEEDKQKSENIKRLTEIIEDYRNWEAPEATFRIYGAYKRLRDLGEIKINLSHCFFEKAYFEKTNFKDAILKNANLFEANFMFANLKGADLSGADLRGANLHRADLSGANLRGADLSGADLRGATLLNSNMTGANLGGTTTALRLKIGNYFPKRINTHFGAPFNGAIVEFNWFEMIINEQVIGADEIIRSYKIIGQENSDEFTLER